MPDANSHTIRSGDWNAMFAALAEETPPADGWSRVSDRLHQRPRRHRRPLWLAAAAAALLAIALPWQLQRTSEPTAARTTVPIAATPAPDPLQPLYAESEQLESLLRLTRDDRVASAVAAAMASELDARIAAIDSALMQSDLPGARQRDLWQARVDTLRTAAGFASTRRWLAVHGTRDDASLIQID